jgi:hypothetical protein
LVVGRLFAVIFQSAINFREIDNVNDFIHDLEASNEKVKNSLYG